MFASNPVVEVVPKRYGVQLRSLPPIETLQPETLKDFTKEDLRCYLEAAGITPGITKPELKRQMRSLINQINGAEDKRFSTQFPVALQPSFAPAVQYIPQPLPPPTAVGGGGGSLPNFAEGDIQCADCPKKGNKECTYKRCRTCCLRKMKELGYRYSCGPHLRDSDRRPNTRISNLIQGLPMVPGPPPPIPTPLARTQSMPAPPVRYPSVPSMPSMASLPLPPTPSAVMTPIQPVPTVVSTPIAVTPTAFPTPQPAPPPPTSPMDASDVSPYSVAECPRCHKVVSALGVNLWLHMKECDPDHIMDYVRLLHEGKLATPTLTDKEKTDPYRIAHQHATQRYQQNMEYLQEIFSGASVEELIAWHAAAPDREDEQRRAVDAFARAVERMAGASEKQERFLDEFRKSSSSFHEHLARLDSCATLEELAARKREFERDFPGLRADPVPEVVLIKRGRGSADESESVKVTNLSGTWGNGKGCNSNNENDREMVDVSEGPPISLVSL